MFTKLGHFRRSSLFIRLRCWQTSGVMFIPCSRAQIGQHLSYSSRYKAKTVVARILVVLLALVYYLATTMLLYWRAKTIFSVPIKMRCKKKDCHYWLKEWWPWWNYWFTSQIPSLQVFNYILNAVSYHSFNFVAWNIIPIFEVFDSYVYQNNEKIKRFNLSFLS